MEYSTPARPKDMDENLTPMKTEQKEKWNDDDFPPYWDEPWHCNRAEGASPDSGYLTSPVGPGDYLLHWTFPIATDRALLSYEFLAGTEALLLEDGPEGKIHELKAPAGEVETPAIAPSTKWILRLPADTTVYFRVTRLRWDREHEIYKTTPEYDELVARLVEELKTERGLI
jgi:hypothetical protein